MNLHAGYHYHAVTDCLNKSAPAAAHGAQAGMVLDGHMIFAHQTADGQTSADLDRCSGHTLHALGDHSILACLSAEAGCTRDGDAPSLSFRASCFSLPP